MASLGRLFVKTTDEEDNGIDFKDIHDNSFDFIQYYSWSSKTHAGNDGNAEKVMLLFPVGWYGHSFQFCLLFFCSDQEQIRSWQIRKQYKKREIGIGTLAHLPGPRKTKEAGQNISFLWFYSMDWDLPCSISPARENGTIEMFQDTRTRENPCHLDLRPVSWSK